MSIEAWFFYTFFNIDSQSKRKLTQDSPQLLINF